MRLFHVVEVAGHGLGKGHDLSDRCRHDDDQDAIDDDREDGEDDGDARPRETPLVSIRRTNGSRASATNSATPTDISTVGSDATTNPSDNAMSTGLGLPDWRRRPWLAPQVVSIALGDGTRMCQPSGSMRHPPARVSKLVGI